MFYATYLDVKKKKKDLEIRSNNYCVNQGYINLSLNDTNGFVSPTESPDVLVRISNQVKVCTYTYLFL